MMQKDKKYIAFVCTGNTCRSPMAEGIFNKLAKKKRIDTIAESFGILAQRDTPVSQYSYMACMEMGVDLSKFKSSPFDDADLHKYEKFYCMSQNHASILNEFCGVPTDKIKVLDIEDPYGGSIDLYRNCCGQIYDAVCAIIEEYEN